ncbi:unnamed protein product [Meloidogyne enterolobii]|uniref:Uncharacterized protein n=1 Tax=Meloidogyne enterolobii TaxID=390850 RepID=A0ACB1AFN6_MELEN
MSEEIIKIIIGKTEIITEMNIIVIAADIMIEIAKIIEKIRQIITASHPLEM